MPGKVLTPTGPPFSPAATLLLEAGITVSQLARSLNRSKSGVSMMLSGQRLLDPALLPVVRALAGKDVADRVEAAILDARQRRTGLRLDVTAASLGAAS